MKTDSEWSRDPIQGGDEALQKVLMVFRTAQEEGKSDTIGVGTLTGIARRQGFLKRWKDLYTMVRNYPELFKIKGRRISLTSMGRKKAEELLGETKTVPVQLSNPKPNLYILKGYTTTTNTNNNNNVGGVKQLVNMKFYSEVLLLDRNHQQTVIPTEIVEVVGYIKCLTCGSTLNYQSPRPVEKLPHIKYLTAYLLKELQKTCAKEQELAVLKTLSQLYPDHKEYTAGQDQKVYLVKTALSPLAVCTSCQSTNCTHTQEIIRKVKTAKKI
ncbi:MAG: hypothetical protein QW261_09130 [Candidatus Jordarchaeaceae archaeon]